MSALRDTPEIVKDELLPLLDELCRLTGEAGERDQLAFFDRIRSALQTVSEPDDMAGPFMELSTSAFRGFAFGFEVSLVLDRALEVAQSLSMALSASSEEMQ